MNLPVDRVQQIMKMAQQPISLQSPVGDGDDTSFGDFIEDKSAENPYDMTAYSLLREKIIDVLDTLTERERRVLSLRFGLVDRRNLWVYPLLLGSGKQVFAAISQRLLHQTTADTQTEKRP